MQKSFYRLLHNPRLEKQEVKEFIYADCWRQVESGRHYLVFQDTTQPNFERNADNITDKSGLGKIGDNSSLGFFLHPSLVVDAEGDRCIGFADIQDWSRPFEQLDKMARGYKGLPFEEKESYRWHRAGEECRHRLASAGMMTMVSDREGDITECLSLRGDWHVLIRSRDNRVIQGGKLYDYLQSQPARGSYKLRVKGEARIGRLPRTATIEVKYSKVALKPGKLNGSTIDVYAVEAREIGCPEGQDPILWRLLTTHEVADFSQACQIIEWYGMRWNIELVFRLIKQKGLNVEGSDMETGHSLILLTLLALLAASKVMLLHLASKDEMPAPVKNAFTEQEMTLMEAVCKKYEGNTARQKNPFPNDTIQWCYWVIARLGGWKPQEKQAGVISLSRGWNRFQQMFEGWLMAKEFVS